MVVEVGWVVYRALLVRQNQLSVAAFILSWIAVSDDQVCLISETKGD